MKERDAKPGAEEGEGDEGLYKTKYEDGVLMVLFLFKISGQLACPLLRDSAPSGT